MVWQPCLCLVLGQHTRLSDLRGRRPRAVRWGGMRFTRHFLGVSPVSPCNAFGMSRFSFESLCFTTRNPANVLRVQRPFWARGVAPSLQSLLAPAAGLAGIVPRRPCRLYHSLSEALRPKRRSNCHVNTRRIWEPTPRGLAASPSPHLSQTLPGLRVVAQIHWPENPYRFLTCLLAPIEKRRKGLLERSAGKACRAEGASASELMAAAPAVVGGHRPV